MPRKNTFIKTNVLTPSKRKKENKKGRKEKTSKNARIEKERKYDEKEKYKGERNGRRKMIDNNFLKKFE